MAEGATIEIRLEGSRHFTGAFEVARSKLSGLLPRQRSPGEEAVRRRWFSSKSWALEKAKIHTAAEASMQLSRSELRRMAGLTPGPAR